jgi:curved DNA-binding protein CbpA
MPTAQVIKTAMQDYYEILQVHPRADADSIEAAYRRLRERYDPLRMEGAADELVELARRRRDAIERAYAVLSDAQRRANYDREQADRAAAATAPKTTPQPGPAEAATEAELDYRPLAPAGGQERVADFETQPVRGNRRRRQRSGRATRSRAPAWLMPAVLVGGLTFAVVLAGLLIAGTPATGQSEAPAIDSAANAAAATPTDDQIVNQFEARIPDSRQVTINAPENVNSWINYGNLLYDSVQVVRERMPDSDLYQERLPRWLEASEAYRQALELDPDNALVRSDLAASLCFYGAGMGDAVYIEQGIAEARQAVGANPDEGRVLLNLGICLVQADPPQTAEALEQWRRVLAVAPPESGIAFEAQRLLNLYGNS